MTSPPQDLKALRDRLKQLRAYLARRPDAPGSFMVRAVDDQGQADARLVELAVVP